MSEEVKLLTEIRDLLEVIAEPAIAKRDEKLRTTLRRVVGTSNKKAAAALLMDGTRSQAVIASEVGIDRGDLSRLVKALTTANLVAGNGKNPKLVVKVPANFFDKRGVNE